MNTDIEIIERTKEMSDLLVFYRRDFHKYAESGWLESRTTSLIARYLTEMGYRDLKLGEKVCEGASRMGLPTEAELAAGYRRAAEQGGDPEFLPLTKGGFTGVIAELDCGEGPTVALRFDIDALGVTEASDPEHRPAREGFASVNTGTAHACGHDCHIAIGLGTARVLMSLKNELRGKVRLIFQPAEEGCRGAKAIVENGWLDDVDYVIGNHMAGGRMEPDFDLIPGRSVAVGSATTKLDVEFSGKSAHAGSAPQAGCNALLAAASAVLNLNAIPRHGGGYSRINVGTLRAGTGRNVIPDKAYMEMEVRGETTEINQYMYDYAVRVLESSAAAHGCTVQTRVMGEALTARNDQPLRELFKASCERAGLSCRPLDFEGDRGGAAEDFTYMMAKVQERGGKALMFNTLSRCDAEFHNGRIDFDESRLANGVIAFCAVTAALLSKTAE